MFASSQSLQEKPQLLAPPRAVGDLKTSNLCAAIADIKRHVEKQQQELSAPRQSVSKPSVGAQ